MPPSILQYITTATADTVFCPVPHEVWLEYADIFCYTNDCNFGDAHNQDIDILAGDSYSIPHPVNINDLYFKNAGAGANTKIVIIGTPYRRKK